MKTSTLNKSALSVSILGVLLASCGGSQPPIGGRGATTQAPAAAAHVDHGTSWMLPEAKSEDLLYAAAPVTNEVYVASYSTHKLVGTLTDHFARPLGVCADQAGDVFIVNTNPSYPTVVEYAHGGTSPIATLYNAGEYPNDCSIDATTGNLAVLDWYPAGVAIYAGAKGLPTIYTDPYALYLVDCTYDSSGNIFVAGSTAGFILDELPAGRSAKWEEIRVSKKLRPQSAIQWDGTYLAIADAPRAQQRDVYRMRVSRGIATVVDSLKLRGATGQGQPWIGQGFIIFNDEGDKNAKLKLWSYPNGKGRGRIDLSDEGFFFRSALGGPGVALSVAPH